MRMLKDSLFWLLMFLAAYSCFSGFRMGVSYAQPAVTQSYGLTLERDDFPAATAGQTTFQTAVQTRSSFAIVFRNGLLQRPCGTGQTPGPGVPCDYTASGNVIATFPATTIQAGDLVTLFFYR